MKKMSDDALKACLTHAKDFMCKTYVPKHIIKSNCPNVRLSEVEEYGMMAYEIQSDDIDKFLNTYEFECIYVPKNSDSLGEQYIPNSLGYKLVVKSITTYIIKCKIKGPKNV